MGAKYLLSGRKSCRMYNLSGRFDYRLVVIMDSLQTKYSV